MNVGDSCMSLADCRDTVGCMRICPCCLYYFFGTHFLSMDILLSLDIVERALVLGAMCLALSGGEDDNRKREKSGER